MTGDFADLLQDVLIDPARGDYTALRIAWTTSSLYQPYGRDSEGVEELHMRVASGAFQAAVDLAARLLVDVPLSVPIRLLYAQALTGAGDRWEAGDHRAFAHGLCKAILRSGDGRSKQTALVVYEPSEIKLTLDLLKLVATRSHQLEHEGRWFDRIEARGADGSRDVWFDVTVMHEWLSQAS